jgi:hypothetical protein
LTFATADEGELAGSFGRLALRLEASHEPDGKISELEMDVTWEEALALADQIRRLYGLRRDQQLIHTLREIVSHTKSTADSTGGILANPA